MHVNNEYIYDGNKIDPKQLFQFTDMTDEVDSVQHKIYSRINELKSVIESRTAPDISPSRHCFNPYKCEFWEHCTADMPDSWVIHLSGISQDKFLSLRHLGIDDIADIPDGFPLSAIQDRIRKCVVNNEEFISPELHDKLTDVQYPIHFLDFETFATAIPKYANAHPYQTIPFQWSDHILNPDGTIDHLEYLCMEDKDPRQEFAETLIKSVGTSGTIFIYTTYEKGVLEQLISIFPEYSEKLNAIIARFSDLYDVIRKHYYHPGFQGSFSLKSVLPTLLTSLSYSTLNIQEGSIASLEYLRMIDPGTREDEKQAIKNNLLIYCGHDTLAMVKIREELLTRSSAT
jgi:predicted RecB family nuclease